MWKLYTACRHLAEVTPKKTRRADVQASANNAIPVVMVISFGATDLIYLAEVRDEFFSFLGEILAGAKLQLI